MSLLKRIYVQAPPPLQGRTKLREWWSGVLRERDRYQCCAIFLLLPSDHDTINYLIHYGQELEILSGECCLIICIVEDRVRQSGLSWNDWEVTKESFGDKVLNFFNFRQKEIVSKHVESGYSAKFAEMFGIRYTEFPCMLVFQDVRSAEHTLVSLKDLTTQEISQRMRVIFSVIQTALIDRQNPVTAIENRKNHEAFINTGKTIIGDLGKVASRTLENGMDAWIKTLIK